MFEYIYQWVENIAFYLVIFTVAMQLIPNKSYKNYIQFFVGLILIIMIANPIIALFGMEQEFNSFFESTEYQQKIKEIEESTKYLEDISGEIK